MASVILAAMTAVLVLLGAAQAETLPPEQSRGRGDDAFASGDFALAAQWYRAAADKGNTAAQVMLGWLYREGRGVSQDYAEAVRWFRLAALLGSAGADYSLGTLYENGRGVAQDYREAASFYRKSAEKGNAQAQNNLGWLYQNGRGVPQDFSEAARWYRKAADQGQPDAEGNLGLLYLEGKGVPQNRREGLRWLKLAAAGGDTEAQAVIDRSKAEVEAAQAEERREEERKAEERRAAARRAEQQQDETRRLSEQRAEERQRRAEERQRRRAAEARLDPAPQPAAVEPTAPARPIAVAPPPTTSAIVGGWQSRGPIVDQGLRKMYLRLQIARSSVTFHYDCRFLDGSRLTGSFSSRAEVLPQSIRILDGGRGHAEDGNNTCSASLRPTTLPYRIEADDLAVEFGEKTVALRRTSD